MAARIDPKLKKAYEFFKANAGGRVGHSAEDCLALARAEAVASSLGWAAEWEHDDHPWDSDDDYEPAEVLGCVLKDMEGKVLGSLWGIGDPTRKYMRVVEAELALEALDEKDLL